MTLNTHTFKRFTCGLGLRRSSTEAMKKSPASAGLAQGLLLALAPCAERSGATPSEECHEAKAGEQHRIGFRFGGRRLRRWQCNAGPATSTRRYRGKTVERTLAKAQLAAKGGAVYREPGAVKVRGGGVAEDWIRSLRKREMARICCARISEHRAFETICRGCSKGGWVKRRSLARAGQCQRNYHNRRRRDFRATSHARHSSPPGVTQLIES